LFHPSESQSTQRLFTLNFDGSVIVIAAFHGLRRRSEAEPSLRTPEVPTLMSNHVYKGLSTNLTHFLRKFRWNWIPTAAKLAPTIVAMNQDLAISDSTNKTTTLTASAA
jgi:hypothetical protein